MSDLLSLLTLIATGLATLSNVVLVAKRYKESKDALKHMSEMEKEISLAGDKLRDVDKILKNITQKNNGVSPLNNEEREKFEKLIDTINFQVKAYENNDK